MSNRKIEKFTKSGKIDKLIGIADGKDIDLSKEAIAALATIRKDESFNYLVVNLRNSKKEIRLAAIKALGEIGYPRGRTHLAHIVETDSDNEIIEAAREAALKLMD